MPKILIQKKLDQSEKEIAGNLLKRINVGFHDIAAVC